MNNVLFFSFSVAVVWCLSGNSYAAVPTIPPFFQTPVLAYRGFIPGLSHGRQTPTTPSCKAYIPPICSLTTHIILSQQACSPTTQQALEAWLNDDDATVVEPNALLVVLWSHTLREDACSRCQ